MFRESVRKRVQNGSIIDPHFGIRVFVFLSGAHQGKDDLPQ
jgi:hypothetical protein